MSHCWLSWFVQEIVDAAAGVQKSMGDAVRAATIDNYQVLQFAQRLTFEFPLQCFLNADENEEPQRLS